MWKAPGWLKRTAGAVERAAVALEHVAAASDAQVAICQRMLDVALRREAPAGAELPPGSDTQVAIREMLPDGELSSPAVSRYARTDRIARIDVFTKDTDTVVVNGLRVWPR